MQPLCYKVSSKELLMLKQKKTILRQLKKQLIINKNLQESTLNLPCIDPTVKKTLCKIISFLEKSIKDMEQSLTSSTEDVLSEQSKLLASIKGIGATLATALIITTGCFSQFDNSRQLTRYLGLSPTYEQSGTSVNRRGHINKNGDNDLRCQIYVVVWSASQHNPACKELYIRLRSNGKPGKVAMIAVANKLVRQAFVIVKSGKEYDPYYK